MTQSRLHHCLSKDSGRISVASGIGRGTVATPEPPPVSLLRWARAEIASVGVDRPNAMLFLARTLEEKRHGVWANSID